MCNPFPEMVRRLRGSGKVHFRFLPLSGSQVCPDQFLHDAAVHLVHCAVLLHNGAPKALRLHRVRRSVGHLDHWRLQYDRNDRVRLARRPSLGECHEDVCWEYDW